MNFFKLGIVFLGGGFGCVFRYVIGLFIQKFEINFPFSTLLSNFLACIIFAITSVYLSKQDESQTIKLLVLTGFCGGLSTFSTFGYESFLLFRQQHYFIFSMNILLSLVLCIFTFLFLIKNGFE